MLGKPVLIGSHTFNFSAVSEAAIAAGAAVRVADANELIKQAARILRQHEARALMAENASRFAQQHRGATARTMALLRRSMS